VSSHRLLQQSVWLIILVVSLALFSIPVQAVPITFNAFQELSVKPCGTQTFGFYVINTHPTQNTTVTLKTSGTAAAFVNLSYTFFLVPPASQAFITETVNLPCESKKSPWTFNITATTDDNTVTKLGQRISANITRHVSLSATPLLASTCAAGSSTITILNQGTVDEDISLNATLPSGINATLTIQPRKTTVLAGKSRTADMTVTPKDCTVYGTQTPINLVLTQENNQTITNAVPLTIEPNQLLSVLLKERVVSVLNTTTNATLLVTNAGTDDSTVRITVVPTNGTAANITVVAPPCAKSTSKKETFCSIEFKGNETKEIVLAIKNVNQTRDFSIGFTAKNERSSLTQVIPVRFTTPFVIPSWFNYVLLGILIIAAIVLLYQSFWKKRDTDDSAKEQSQPSDNKKTATSQVAVALDKKQARAMAQLVSKREEERGRLRTEVRTELEDEFYLVPKQSVERRPLFKIIFILLAMLGVLVAGTWFLRSVLSVALMITGAVLVGIVLLVILWRLFLWKTDRRKTVALEVLRPGESITLATGWKQGLGSITLKVTKPWIKPELTFRRSSRSPLFVIPSGKLYHYITITPRRIDTDEIKGPVVFSVARTWMDRHQETEQTIKLLYEMNGSWLPAKTEFVGQDADRIFFAANVPRAIHLAIVGSTPVYQTKKPRRWFTGGLLFLLLIAVLGLAALTAIDIQQEKESAETGMTRIGPLILEQNQAAKLNLSQFFRDPDNTPLTYRYEPAEHLIIVIDEGIARIRPADDGFVGNTTTRFTADDGMGGIVPSNNVTVTIVPQQERTILEQSRSIVLENNAGIMTMLLVALAMVFVLFVRRD